MTQMWPKTSCMLSDNYSIMCTSDGSESSGQQDALLTFESMELNLASRLQNLCSHPSECTHYVRHSFY